MNPLLKMELIREGRGIRLPMMTVFYNCILAFITIMFMFFNTESLQEGIYYDTNTYLYQFLILSSFQLVVVFILTPFMMSAAFEEDYRNHIYEQMLIIPDVTKKYLLSKITLIIMEGLLLFFSSLPIVALSCIYSGISLLKIGRVFIMILVFTFWSGSIALFFYSTSRRGNGALFMTGVVCSVFLIGPLILEELVRAASMLISETGEMSAYASKFCMVLLAFDPAAAYLGFFCNITGDVGIMMNFCSRIGIDATEKWFSFVFYKASGVLCILVACMFLGGAVLGLEHKGRQMVSNF